MKAITAEPCTVSSLFEKRQYEIPEFQRPYTWTEVICGKLWEDLLNFYEKWKSAPVNDRERYFLGSIIVYPRKWNRDLDTDIEEAFCVVDGQQRLTSLTLLIAALHCLAKDNDSLQAAIHVKKNDKVTSELRVLTSVLEDDRFALEEIVNDMYPETIGRDKKLRGKASRKNNFVFFREHISEWFAQTGNDTQQLRDFINMLLKWVVILPIKCGDREDAFNIFEVVNNRGKPLTDADIFKSNILQNLTNNPSQTLNEEQELFLKKWESWCKAGQESFCFRALMRILKAKDGISDSTDESIVTYFQNTKKEYFNNARSLVKDLEKIYLITEWEKPSILNVQWQILSLFPNESWKWPLFCFLFKYGEIAEGKFILDSAYWPDFGVLCKRVTRFMYGRGVIGKGTQTSLKPTTYKECVRIFNSKYDELDTTFILDKGDGEQIKVALDALNDTPCYQAGNRFGSGLVYLSSMLLHCKDMSAYENFSEFVNNGRIDIEHICPKVWSNCDGWDVVTHGELVNTIGNLMPLEKAINISVSNDSFWKKCSGSSLSHRGGVKSYRDSVSPEAFNLGRSGKKNWLPDDVRASSREKIDALKAFFEDRRSDTVAECDAFSSLAGHPCKGPCGAKPRAR